MSMLILTFRNVSDLAPVSDYEWTVLVNHTVLAHGRLEGHERAKGWEALVKQFANTLEEESHGKDK